jgi:tripartite-type tricarboxylate transporter receptor subunit TctC
VKAIENDEGKEFFRRMAMIGKSSTPEALTAYQKEQTALWGRLVKESGLEPQ